MRYLQLLLASIFLGLSCGEGVGVGCLDAEDRGSGYRGTQSITVDGLECQKWSSNVPHEHSFITKASAGLDGLGDHNYCRNPNKMYGVWCYTTDPEKRLDYCSVPTCHCEGNTIKPEGASSCTPCETGTVANWDHTKCDCEGNNIKRVGASSCTPCEKGTVANWEKTKCEVEIKECYEGKTDPKGYLYRGFKTTTKSGLVCQNWTSQTPNKHTRTPQNYPNKGLGNHNYCRNPDGGQGGPWCYSSKSTKPRWEYCGIPKC